jgi:hypothetical protein
MPTIDQLHTSAANYNRAFQEMTARIYADGIITCQEATDGTAYYKSVRPRIRRFDKHIRRSVRQLVARYSARLLLASPEHRQQIIAVGNQQLQAYQMGWHEYEKLLNDSAVMLKIFKDVLQDCE